MPDTSFIFRHGLAPSHRVVLDALRKRYRVGSDSRALSTLLDKLPAMLEALDTQAKDLAALRGQVTDYLSRVADVDAAMTAQAKAQASLSKAARSWKDPHVDRQLRIP